MCTTQEQNPEPPENSEESADPFMYRKGREQIPLPKSEFGILNKHFGETLRGDDF